MADTFKLDASGTVLMPAGNLHFPGLQEHIGWSHLSPFAQGYIGAAFASVRRCFVCQGAGRTKVGEVLNGPRPGPIYKECGECHGSGLVGPIYGKPLGFSDLAPESLAAMMRDCERYCSESATPIRDCAAAGRELWLQRQAGAVPDEPSAFPHLTLYLGDDGKVYQRVVA